MIVSYDDAQSPEAINGRKLLQDNQVLEDLAADVNQTLKLPYDIPLHGSQCDQANAFWNPNEKTITICYEDADLGQKIFTKAGDRDPDASAIGSEDATFYHETGHMAITLYDLPITGREEDVADQLAAYILLTPGDNGKVDAESVQAVKNSRGRSPRPQTRGQSWAQRIWPTSTHWTSSACTTWSAGSTGRTPRQTPTWSQAANYPKTARRGVKRSGSSSTMPGRRCSIPTGSSG